MNNEFDDLPTFQQWKDGINETTHNDLKIAERIAYHTELTDEEKEVLSFDEWKTQNEGWKGALGGALIGAGAGGAAGAIVGGVVGAAATSLIGGLYKNRNEIGMRFYDLMNTSTRGFILDLFEKSLKSVMNDCDVAFTVQSRGTVLYLTSLLRLPRKDYVSIMIEVTERYVSIVPKNTGGSAVFGRAMSNYDSLISNSLGAGGAGGKYLGNNYKIPQRALEYQRDLKTLWLIILDIISELYDEFAEYYNSRVQRLQASKNLHIQHFMSVAEKYDLTQDTLTRNVTGKSTQKYSRG